MKPLDIKVEEIHLENIKPFCKDMTWAGLGKSNGEPIVLYGNSCVETIDPVKVLLELLKHATAADMNEEQGKFMFGNRSDEGCRAAVIFKIVVRKPVSDIIYRGLFIDDTAVTYQFYFQWSRKKMYFTNVRSEECRTSEFQITGDSYDDILTVLTNECRPHAVESHEDFPNIHFGFVSDEEHYSLPNDNHEFKFMKSWKLQKGNEKPKIVRQIGSDQGKPDKQKENAVKFYNMFEYLCFIDVPNILFVGMINVEVVLNFKATLNKRKTKKQVIIVTKLEEICELCTYQHLFFTKYINFHDVNYGKERNVWGILAFEGSSETAQSLHDKYGSDVLLKELVLAVEGREDIKLIKQWVEECKNFLKKSPSVDTFMNFIKHEMLEELSLIKKELLIHMLSGIHVVPMHGKIHLVEKINQLSKISVPHCVVVDADALFVMDGETGMSAKDTKKLLSRTGTWDFKFDEEIITWRGSPVTELLLSISKQTSDHAKAHYPELFRKMHKLIGITDWNEYLTKKKELKAMNIFKCVQKYGRIFSWMKADGTTSGAMCMNKNEVLSVQPSKVIRITRQMVDEHPDVAGNELNRFIKFLCTNVFRHYTRFLREKCGKLCNEYDDRTPPVVVEKRTEAMKTKISMQFTQRETPSYSRVQSVGNMLCNMAGYLLYGSPGHSYMKSVAELSHLIPRSPETMKEKTQCENDDSIPGTFMNEVGNEDPCIVNDANVDTEHGRSTSTNQIVPTYHSGQLWNTYTNQAADEVSLDITETETKPFSLNQVVPTSGTELPSYYRSMDQNKPYLTSTSSVDDTKVKAEHTTQVLPDGSQTHHLATDDEGRTIWPHTKEDIASETSDEISQEHIN